MPPTPRTSEQPAPAVKRARVDDPSSAGVSGVAAQVQLSSTPGAAHTSTTSAAAGCGAGASGGGRGGVERRRLDAAERAQRAELGAHDGALDAAPLALKQIL